MRVIVLIGANFMRSQWLALIVILLYVAGINSFVGWNMDRAEVAEFVRLQALYAMSFVALIAVPALHTEKQSRRILAVLSKGIRRSQYLAGLLCGCAMMAAFFCAAIGLATWILTRKASIPATGLAAFLLMVFVAGVTAAAVGIFWATFLHPLAAVTAASIVLAGPSILEFSGRQAPWMLFPVTSAAHVVMGFNFPATGQSSGQSTGNAVWLICVASVIHLLIFWMAASAIFARRDVTISAE